MNDTGNQSLVSNGDTPRYCQWMPQLPQRVAGSQSGTTEVLRYVRYDWYSYLKR